MDRISGRSLAARLFGASPARTLALLQAAWPLAVGPELARRTEVLGSENGTLRVRVPDASWRKVLHRIQPQILGKLRELAGDLAPRRMGFVEGGIPVNSRPQSEAAPQSGGDLARGVSGGAAPRPSRTIASAPPDLLRSPPDLILQTPDLISSTPPRDLSALAAVIPDPEIRARFAATAARYLARSKGHEDA
jgi:hypothetical protein